MSRIRVACTVNEQLFELYCKIGNSIVQLRENLLLNYEPTLRFLTVIGGLFNLRNKTRSGDLLLDDFMCFFAARRYFICVKAKTGDFFFDLADISVPPRKPPVRRGDHLLIAVIRYRIDTFCAA